MRGHFYGLQFDLPPEWTDITEELTEDILPTLARPSGPGVIQFSIARYQDGDDPKVSMDDLRRFLAEFCSAHLLKYEAPIEKFGNITSIGCVSVAGDEMLAAWFLSNRRDIVLATYTSLHSESPETKVELTQVRQIIDSIDF